MEQAVAGPVPERRKHERVQAVVEVSLTSEHNFYTGFTQDISEGGVFIAGIDLFPIGTPVEFALRLGTGAIVLTGVVRWVREPGPDTEEAMPGIGVEFIDLHPVVKDRINEFIRSRRESLFFADDSDPGSAGGGHTRD
jgi:uncharacterized protein (TIGR02266 family)